MRPQRLAVIDGLSEAEGVTYDTARGVYFVSNVNGSVGATREKGNAISRN